MVSFEVRALFVGFLFLEWSTLQLEGRPPPASAIPKSLPTIAAGVPRLEKVLQSSQTRSNDELVPILNIALLSASVGKYFLNRKKNISTECHETAMTAVQLWQRLPIVEQVDTLIQSAFHDVVSDVKNFQAIKNPVTIVCEKIESRFISDPALSQDFRQLKEWFRKNGINKAYTKVIEMPKTNDHAKDLIVEEFEDPIIGRLLAHIAFVNQLKKNKATSREFYTWAKAILSLAKDERIRDSVQTLYDLTRSQTADSIVSPVGKPAFSNSITQVFETEMMRNLKENFHNNSAMKTDFETAVNRIRDSD